MLRRRAAAGPHGISERTSMRRVRHVKVSLAASLGSTALQELRSLFHLGSVQEDNSVGGDSKASDPVHERCRSLRSEAATEKGSAAK